MNEWINGTRPTYVHLRNKCLIQIILAILTNSAKVAQEAPTSSSLMMVSWYGRLLAGENLAATALMAPIAPSKMSVPSKKKKVNRKVSFFPHRKQHQCCGIRLLVRMLCCYLIIRWHFMLVYKNKIAFVLSKRWEMVLGNCGPPYPTLL